MEDGGRGNEKVHSNPIPEKVKGIMGTFKMFCAVVMPPPGERVFCLLEETQAHIRGFLYTGIELQGRKKHLLSIC